MVGKDSTKDDSERRMYERVEFATAIRIIIDTGDKSIEVKGDSKDLSLKGIFIVTKEKVLQGSPCAVKIYLSGSTEELSLQIQGVVARIEDNGLGIFFDSMDVDSFTHLKSIVKFNSDNN